MSTDYVPSDAALVRLLISDTGTGAAQVFTDNQIEDFLILETSVKRAAAQALDVIASNEAMVSKVIRDLDLSTDGAKVADALRKHAVELRKQADVSDEDGDGFVFDIVDAGGICPVELAEWPSL